MTLVFRPGFLVSGLFLLHFTNTCFAQTDPQSGSITGIVLGGDDQIPVAGATISVPIAGLETRSGPDGRYRIDRVPPGGVRIEVSADSYSASGRSVDVLEGSQSNGDIVLKRVREPELIVVFGAPPKSSVAATIDAIEKGPGGTLAIAPDQLSEMAGTGDLSGASKQLPSVTITDGKFLYIRGLGERYSQTLVNGSPIASPEPDRKVVPLDLFPTDMVDLLIIETTYSADRPGDFAGGTLQIITKSVPTRSFFEFGIGLEYVHGTTLRDFASYQGGNLDIFGYDDGTRSLPENLPSTRQLTTLSSEQRQTIARSFPNIWNEQSITAPPGTDLNMTFGTRFDLTDVEPGDDSGPAIGVVGTVNWSNGYQTIADERLKILIQGGSQQNQQPIVRNDWTVNRSSFEAELSAALNIALKLNDGQTVGVRNVFTHAAEDQFRLTEGIDFSSQLPVRISNLRYVERTLYNTQLYGDHLLAGDLFLQWRGGYSLAQRDEPDNRNLRYLFNDTPSVNDFEFDPRSRSGSRDFFLLDENTYDGAIDLSIPFAPFVPRPDPKDLTALEAARLDPEQKIKIGAALSARDRDFDSRRLRFQAASGRPLDENGGIIDETASGEDLFRTKNFNPDGYFLLDETLDNDNYDAQSFLDAFYVLVDVLAVRGLRAQGGVRYEHSDQELTSFAPISGREKVSTLRTDDILPGFNFTWEFMKHFLDEDGYEELSAAWKQQRLRFGVSRTVNRPEFRELAPFQFVDVEGDAQRGIDPELGESLDRAILLNFDLRYEWQPSRNDLIALGAFYKEFTDPIEQVFEFRGEGRVRKPSNAESATLYGVELEVRKHLGCFADWFELDDYAEDGDGNPRRDPRTRAPRRKSPERLLLEGVQFIGNISLLESEVTLKRVSTTIETNDSRPLQGAPDFVLNLGVIWRIEPWDLTLSVLANRFGDRVTTAGAFGVPDEVEESRWSLDAAIVKRLGENAKIKLSFENILDEPYVFTQGSFTTREYRKGWAIGLSYSYSF